MSPPRPAPPSHADGPQAGAAGAHRADTHSGNDRHAESLLVDPGQAARARSRGRNTARRSIFGKLILGAVIIVASIAAVVMLFGRVDGREFAPSHFALRHFSLFEIPLLRVQISPVRYTLMSPPLTAYLRTAGLITPQGGPIDWHLVEMSRGDSSAAPADAKLLVDFLQPPPRRSHTVRLPGTQQIPLAGGGSSGQGKWHRWSVEHPAMAAALWPKIQSLAERDLYLLIPDLFRIAEESTAEPEMTAAIDAFLISSYERMISDLRSAGQGDLAESLRQDAMADYPDHPRWLAD